MMQQFSLKLIDTVSINLQKISFGEGNSFEKVLAAISLLEEASEQLKTFILGYTFKDEAEEIMFFKEIKPQILCKLIYYRKICNVESIRPNGSSFAQKAYFLKELDYLKYFFDINMDFYKYYRSGNTHLDRHYFLRGKPDIYMNLDSFYFERDPKFSTSCDFKVSKILANDMLTEYFNNELIKLEQSGNGTTDTPAFPKAKPTWTDEKNALGELIYAIHTVGSINNGKITVKALTEYFENTLNIDLGDVYHMYREIRSRKGSRTKYIDYLRDKLNERMDNDDNK